MGLIDDARAREAARPERRIDYDRMNRVHPGQKAALTRAVNAYKAAQLALTLRASFDTRPVEVARENVAKVVKAAIDEWNAIGAWPDDWSRWQRALDDVLPWNQRVDINDL